MVQQMRQPIRQGYREAVNGVGPEIIRGIIYSTKEIRAVGQVPSVHSSIGNMHRVALNNDRIRDQQLGAAYKQLDLIHQSQAGLLFRTQGTHVW